MTDLTENAMPKVSVVIITYNHEDFIADAIEGALMQQTDFPYEIIIGEDESEDGTREICIDYAERYPDKIRLFLRSRQDVIYVNGRPTGRFNSVESKKAARGKYIALCEGDDYWTDPHKLQKQVDFLEAHPECSLCFANVMVHYEDGSRETHRRHSPDQKSTLTIRDILVGNPISTCSVVFRNRLIEDFPDWYYELPMGDWPLWVLLAQHGKLGYMDEVVATYRRHSEGVWSSTTTRAWLPGLLKACDVLDHELDFAYHEVIQQTKRNWLKRAAHEFGEKAITSMRPREAAATLRETLGDFVDWDPDLMHQLLGQLYAHYFFGAAARKHHGVVRQSIVGLLRYDPSCLQNRGVLSISCEAVIGSRLADGLRRARRWAAGWHRLASREPS